jgi:dolichyl-phosphate-mannose--protein O-mannosyl transferase
VIPAAIYVASYLPWFGGPTIPFHWNLFELTQQMYWYHSGLTSPHPAGSPWWSWPLVLKPVYWYFGSSSGGDNAYIYDAGNIVLFWGGLVAFVWCAIAAVRARSLALGFIVFAALVQYVAWIPISRVLFFYHFFTVLPFYLLALAAALAYLWLTARVRHVVAYLALATAAFVYFYPFIAAQPVAGTQAAMFFVLPTWTYDCQFYPTFVCTPSLGGSFNAAALVLRLALALAVAGAVALVAFGVAPPLAARLGIKASPEARR